MKPNSTCKINLTVTKRMRKTHTCSTNHYDLRFERLYESLKQNTLKQLIHEKPEIISNEQVDEEK